MVKFLIGDDSKLQTLWWVPDQTGGKHTQRHGQRHFMHGLIKTRSSVTSIKTTVQGATAVEKYICVPWLCLCL